MGEGAREETRVVGMVPLMPRGEDDEPAMDGVRLSAIMSLVRRYYGGYFVGVVEAVMEVRFRTA